MNKMLRRISRNKLPLAFLAFLIFVLVSQYLWLQQHAATYSTDAETTNANQHRPHPEDSTNFPTSDSKKNKLTALDPDGPREKIIATYEDFASAQLDLIPFPNAHIDLEVVPMADRPKKSSNAHLPFGTIFPQLVDTSAAAAAGEEGHIVLCLDDGAERFKMPLESFVIALVDDFPELGQVTITTTTNSNASSSGALCHIRVTAGGVELPSGVASTTQARRAVDPSHESLLLAEGYTLCFVPSPKRKGDLITIAAVSSAGVLNALRTLLALAASPNPQKLSIVKGCIANDVPKLSWRGQHFDTARHFHDKDTILSIIREMGRSKMNVFHWHLSDDQGWRVESHVYPSLHTIGGRRGPSLNGKRFQKYNGKPYPNPMFHTQKEIREIIQFAKNRNIKIVPEIDLPAHAAALVAALSTQGIDTFGISIPTNMANEDCAPIPDDMKNFGAPNCMGGVFGMMLPTKRALAVMTDILNEIFDLFEDSPYIHLGGDEAEFIRDFTWKNVATDLVENGKSMSNFGALQARVMQELIAVAEKRNRTAVVWDETAMELDPAWVPPAPTMPMLWRDDYVGVNDVVKKYRDVLGGEKQFSQNLPRLILTPKTRLYFDYLQYATVSQNKYWPLQRPAPSAKHKAVTLKRAFQAHSVVQSHPIVFGVEGCLWTELLFNASMVKYQLYPRMYAVADVGWSVRRQAALGLSALDPEFELFGDMARRMDRQRTLRG